MGSELKSTHVVRHSPPWRDRSGYSGIVEATPSLAYGIWRDILVSVWRRCPSLAEAERECETLTRLAESVDAPGYWLLTESACEIPSVAVRRLMAERLRRLKPLRTFSVCVRAHAESDAALMRAAIRMTAVAGGNKAAFFGADVPSVAAHLSALYPSLSLVWAERAVRVLSNAESGL